MKVEVCCACDGSPWAGAMPGEPVYLGALGVSLIPWGLPCGSYQSGPAFRYGRLMITIRAELAIIHPAYWFNELCSHVSDGDGHCAKCGKAPGEP